jgi:hypothetical protein
MLTKTEFTVKRLVDISINYIEIRKNFPRWNMKTDTISQLCTFFMHYKSMNFLMDAKAA